jgi:hypothetical protein
MTVPNKTQALTSLLYRIDSMIVELRNGNHGEVNDWLRHIDNAYADYEDADDEEPKLKYTVIEVDLPSFETGDVSDIKDFTDPVEAMKYRDELEYNPDIYYAVEVNTVGDT